MARRMLLALALLGSGQDSAPRQVQEFLRGGTFTVEWREPEPWPADVEIELERSTLSRTAVFPNLEWIRLRPLDDGVEVTRVQYRGETESSPIPTVTVEQALGIRGTHEKILSDLAWIAAARLVRRPDMHARWSTVDGEIWVSVRAASGEETLYESRWAGSPSSSNEIERAKVEAAARRVGSGVDALDFRAGDLTPEVRTWASRKFARDVASVPDFRSLRALTLGLIAPLGDARAWAAIPDRAPVRLRVLDEGDRPVADARVEAIRRRLLLRSRGISAVARFGEPGGRFVLLEPGGYTLRVDAPGRPERRVPLRIEDASPREVTVRLPAE